MADLNEKATAGEGLARSIFQSCVEMDLACGWVKEVRDYLIKYSEWTPEDQEAYLELMADLTL
jgi:hypothetical protein